MHGLNDGCRGRPIIPTKPIILWFRNDLRIADHPALSAAVAAGAPIVPAYVLDESIGTRPLGGASRWWLHHSLSAIQERLVARGARLVLRRGPAVDVIADLAADVDATAVYCSRGFEPGSGLLEASLRDRLAARDIAFKRFAGALLHDPDQLRTKAGHPFKVYTPFWRALSAAAVRPCQSAPTELPTYRPTVTGDRLDDWALCPTAPDWAAGIRAAWQPGEAAAEHRLAAFLTDSAAAYKQSRDRPDLAATSRLSPHLRFGEISPARCWHAALHHEQRDTAAQGLETFRKELAWREFSYHLLHHWPTLPTEPFRTQFNNFPWAQHAGHLAAWQRGRTGYPIVDAGMRELWTTGWMHNRVRMVAASFLTKHLLIPWQAGETWFWDCLVDADPASNAASWQWVAGCGADAAPYFRIFNPVMQGQKFDAAGDYVRRWLPDRYLQAPWTCPADELDRAGVVLGTTYPAPLVDHAAARARALAAYDAVKSAAQ